VNHAPRGGKGEGGTFNPAGRLEKFCGEGEGGGGGEAERREERIEELKNFA